MRALWLCLIVPLMFVTVASSALASPGYPQTVVTTLGLHCEGGVPDSWGCRSGPGCTLCHTTCPGEPGSATQPFAQTLTSPTYGLQASLSGQLSFILGELAEAGTASVQGACLSDINTLKACRDPNQPCPPRKPNPDAGDGGGETGGDAGTFSPPVFVAPAAPPTYGCVGQIAPTAGALGVSSLISTLGLAAAVVRRRRTRQRGAES
jgi:hypothetical protein